MMPVLLEKTALDDLAQARAIVEHEADLLDRLAYADWLEMWGPDGYYVLPIDREAQEFATRLNHIYDDAVMRKQRVERLLSGHAPSASPIMRTVRMTGRFRLIEADDAKIVISSSLLIVTYKRQVKNLIVADVTHRLLRSADGLKIDEKLVRLINSDDPLSEMSFLP